MSHRKLTMCAAVVLLGHLPASAQWTSIGTGIDYQRFDLSGPNKVFVARMAIANASAFIESSVAQGKLYSGTETVPAQATRYEDAIGYWGQDWGTRNDVVVAINGSFFDTSNGMPWGGVVHSGSYDKRHDDVGGSSGFAWTLNRAAFIGECVTHMAHKQLITYADATTQQFQGINRARGSDELVIYTPMYDSDTNTDNTGSEVVVELSRPFLLMPSPSSVVGTVKQIRQNLGSTQIPFDCIVLSAKGTAATTMLSKVSVGATISFSQEIHSFTGDCSTPRSLDWTKTYAGISGNWVFIKNGVVQYNVDPLNEVHPRTAIAINDTYVFFIIVDGRQSGWSVGMTINALADFCKNTLAATWACNQDGGGSSTMWVNGTVMNSPSDGSLRPVANGMLMCNFLAKAQSTTFASGSTVTANGTATVRLGPGTNYASIASISSGTQGTILAHAMRGVYAKGSYWWQVQFPTATGWVTQTQLTGGGSCTAPAITTHPSNQSVAAGGTAQFTVAASGTTPFTYQWQKNSVNLANGGHYSGATTATLTVSNADANDQANYRCVVTNSCGSATSNQATLTVTSGSGPEFIVESRSGGLNYANYSETGTWSSATCKSTATGTTAGIGSRYCTINSTAKSAVFRFTPSTGGTYNVYTTNCNTSNSGNPLVHWVTHAGGTASVGVCQNSTCATNAINKWHLLGSYTLNAGVQYTVTLDGSTTGGSGPSGNAGRSDAVKWESTGGGGGTAPSITQHPTNQSVAAGGTANFSVTATGTTPLSYQWQKNSVNLSNGGHYSGATTATLTISNADSNDAANYRCVVTNAYGTATSNQASLTVTGGATVVLFDDFDSYAAQSNFTAAWPLDGSASGTLSTVGYFSSPKSIYIDTTARRNARNFTASTGSNTTPIVWSVRFYDAGSASLDRQYVELQDAAPSVTQIVAMGKFNSLNDMRYYYSARVAYAPGPGWVVLNDAGAPGRSVGWHELKAVIKSTTIDFYVDGILAKANVAYASAQGVHSFDRAKIGSNVTSTNIAYYDDFLVQLGQ